MEATEHKMCESCKNLIETIYEDLKAMVLMTDIPHGSEPAEEDVEAVMWWQVSKYFKDKFNVGDYEDDELVKTLAMEGPNQFNWVYYKPTCKFGWDNCIHDPAYIYATYPDWYKELYGDKSPEEAAADEEEGCTHCTDQCCHYDDEDK